MNPVEHRVVKQICLRVLLTEIRCALSLGSQFAFRFRIYRPENGYKFPFLFCVCIALENGIRTGETDLQLPFPVFCQCVLAGILQIKIDVRHLKKGVLDKESKIA